MEELEFRPIYQQISDSLKQKIVSGVFTSGSMLPTEDILSGQYKVSKPTIRKALEILKTQRLISKQNGRGTFITYETVNTMKPKRIGIYGVHQNVPNDFYQSQLFAGMAEEAGKTKSIELIVLPRKEDCSSLLMDMNLDGIILISPSTEEIKDFIKTSLASIPHVIVSASGDMIKKGGFNFIDSDNTQGAYEAVSHLIKLGHRKIVYNGGKANQFNSADRLKGYKKALSDNAIPIDHNLINEILHKTDYDTNIYMESLIKNKTPFSAVFAGGLGLTLATVKFLKEKGFRIPEDVSVAGFDDFEAAMFMSPPLTTVRQPIFELGENALRMLIDQLYGEKLKSRHVYLKTELIIRRSTEGRNK